MVASSPSESSDIEVLMSSAAATSEVRSPSTSSAPNSHSKVQHTIMYTMLYAVNLQVYLLLLPLILSFFSTSDFAFIFLMHNALQVHSSSLAFVSVNLWNVEFDVMLSTKVTTRENAGRNNQLRKIR